MSACQVRAGVCCLLNECVNVAYIVGRNCDPVNVYSEFTREMPRVGEGRFFEKTDRESTGCTRKLFGRMRRQKVGDDRVFTSANGINVLGIVGRPQRYSVNFLPTYYGIVRGSANVMDSMGWMRFLSEL